MKKLYSCLSIFCLLLFTFSANAQCDSATQLVTSYATNNGQRGVMFDIHAKKEVKITCFDANLYAGTTADYRIYYRSGSFIGHESSSADWTLIDSVSSLTSAGTDVPTAIPIAVNLTISSGDTMAFYITNTYGGGVNYTEGASSTTTLASDSNITVTGGVGKSYPFALTYSYRYFNGTIHYESEVEAPVVSTPLTYCQGATASALTATGSSLKWYTAATGGTGSSTAPTPSTSTVGSTTYYVSQTKTIGGVATEGPRAAITVIINTKPSAPTVSTPVNYCQGTTATVLSATKPSSTDTLYWYTSASGGTGSITAPTPSTSTLGTSTYYVSAKNTSGCEGPRAAITVNINTAPSAPTVGTPVNYCQGTTATALNASKASSTDTLYWYSTASGGTGSITAPIPSTSTLGTSTYYVSAKNTSGCEGPRSAITVNINTAPSAPTVSTPVSYCQGAIVSALNATKASSSDTLYWYTVASGGVGSTSAPTPMTTTIGSTTYYVSARGLGGCEGARASITVNINPKPSAPTVSTPITYCQGATATALNASKASSSDTLYWYTVASGGTGSTTAPIPSTSSVGSATYYVSAKNTSGCEGPRSAITVNINTVPSAPTVSTPVNYCEGATATALSASKASSSDTLYWYITASGGSGSITAPTPSTSTIGSTTYYVSAKNTSGCEGPRAAISVYVNPTPAVPTVTSTITYCQGATATLLSATKPSATDTLYWYTVASGGVGSTSAPTPMTTTIGSTTYYVSARGLGGCEGARAGITVNINPKPSTPTVSTPITYCQGATATALSATKPSSSDTLYWYSSASGGTGSTTAPTPYTSTVGSTTYYVSAKNTSGCEGPKAAISVNINPTPTAPTTTATITYCQGATAAALTASKASSSDTLYWYTSASGGTGSTTAPTPSTSTVGSTTYYVSAKNTSGCEGPRAAINVIINLTVSAPTVTPTITYCQGATAAALTATKASSSDTLYWYTSASGGTGSTTAPTPSTSMVGSTTYYVSAKNTSGCEGPRAAITVNINPTPAAPIVTSTITYCQGAIALPLSATKASASDTLYWFSSASGGTGSTTAPTPSTSTVGSSTYYVSAKNTSGCEGPRAATTVNINPTLAAPIVTSTITYCQGATAATLTATKASGSDTLYWYTSASGGTGSTTAPTPSTSTVGSNTYYVSAKNTSGCEGPRAAISVGINPTPTAPAVTTTITYCQGTTVSALTATKSSSSDTLYWYTSASGGTGSTTAPTPSTSTVGSSTYYVSAKNTSGCEGPRAAITVNINPTPAAPIVTSTITYCQGAIALPLSATKASASDTLYWFSSASGGTGSTTAPTPSTSTIGSTTYYVSAKNTSGCEGPRAATTVNINPTLAAPIVTSTITYCQGATAAALTATKASSSDTLYWYSSASGGIGSTSAPTPSTSTVGSTTYYVSAKNTSGCEGPRATINVNINPRPAAPAVTPTITYCQGTTVSALTATKSSSSDTLYWYASASGGTGSTTAPTPYTSTVGSSTYYVSAKNTSGCEGPRAAITVNINPTPAAPIVTSTITYCQGAIALPLSATKASATDTLYWFSSASGGTGSTTAPTPNTSTVGSSTYYVSAKNTSGCEGPRAATTVNINPTLAAPIVTSTITYCQGATASALTATKASSSDTLYWYTSASGGTGSTTAPTPSTSTVGSSTYYVSAKNTSGCEGPRAAINVNINPRPAAPTTTFTITYCQGTTVSALTASKASSSDTLYWYTSASGGTGSTTAPTPSTSTVGSSTYYVSAKNTSGCEGPRAAISVNVNPTPALPTVTATITYCQGSTATALSATKPSSTDTLYWYTTASGGTGSTTAPTPSTSTVGSTTYYVSAKNTSGCEGPRAAISVIINATVAAPAVTATITYCQGATAAALTATKPSSSDTLYWYISASGGTGSTTAPTPSTSTVGSTTYYVSAKNTSGCEGPRAAISVNINPTPAAPTTTAAITYCQGATAAPLTASKASSSDTLYWYTSASGGTGSTTSPTPATSTVGSTTYYVSAKNISDCEGPRAAITVHINPTPAAPTTTATITYCQGATAAALTASKASSSDTLYWYTSASGGTGSTTSPTPATSTVGYSTYYVSAKNTSGCEGPRAPITVHINPTPVTPTVSSTITYCQGVTAAALSATKSASSDTLYWYTSASGGTGSITAPTPLTTIVGSTTYYVSAKNTSGCEGPRTAITVNIKRTPNAPLVSSPITYCQNDLALILGARKESSDDTLKWFDVGYGSLSSAPYPSTTSPGTSIYYVSAVSVSGCEGPKAKIEVIVNPSPLAPTVTSPVQYCIGTEASPLSASGTNLKWYTEATGGSSFLSLTPSTSDTGSNNYYVSQTSALGCEGPRAKINVIVHPAPTVAIAPVRAPAFVYCKSDSVSIKALCVDAVSYQWAQEGIDISGATSDTLSVSNEGNYRVIVNNIYGCSDTDAVRVIQNPLPEPYLSPKDVYICEGVNIMLFTTPAGDGYRYEWYKDGSKMPIDSLLSKTPVNNSGYYYVKVTDYYACVLNTNTVRVNTYPAIPKPTILRTGNLLRLSASFAYYQWYRNGKIIPSANSRSYTMLFDGAYSVVVRNENDCEAVSDTVIRNNLSIIRQATVDLPIKIYPNPSKGKVLLECDIPLSVRVVSISGKELLNTGETTEIDLSDFADGIYFFYLYDKEGNLIKVEKVHKFGGES